MGGLHYHLHSPGAVKPLAGPVVVPRLTRVGGAGAQRTDIAESRGRNRRSR